MNAATASEVEALEAKSAFTVGVIPRDLYFATRANQSLSLQCHENVLRPLLRVTLEAWAYELTSGSSVMASAGDILARNGGKYKISLHSEPITGHELFWNASGGQRGSIVMLFKPNELPASEIFPHCERAFIVNNPSVPHSPAAYRYVKTAVASGSVMAAMLSRSNGMQWLSFHGIPALLIPMYSLAKSLVRGADTHAP